MKHSFLLILLSSPLIFFAQDEDAEMPFGKHEDMIILNDKPWNIESQPHILNDDVTPASSMFVRNNGKLPKDIDASTWTLTIDGESVVESKTYTLEELKTKFQHYTYQLTLECGGNGRKEFDPPAKGNQWSLGAINCAEWTGVRLRDVLEDAGIKSDAVKDYKDGAKKKLMPLGGTEFLRRFCLHILPHGFRKVRQYGFLSNASKSKLLQQARLALGEKLKRLLTRKERKEKVLQRLFGEKENRCPCCQKGIMVGIYSWEVAQKKTKNKAPPPFYNTILTKQ